MSKNCEITNLIIPQPSSAPKHAKGSPSHERSGRANQSPNQFRDIYSDVSKQNSSARHSIEHESRNDEFPHETRSAQHSVRKGKNEKTTARTTTSSKDHARPTAHKNTTRCDNETDHTTPRNERQSTAENRQPATSKHAESSREDKELKQLSDAQKRRLVHHMRDALLKLGDTLNFSVTDELEGLSIDHVTEKMIDDFAEIVHCLEQIAKLLDNAVAENRIIDIRGIKFDAAQSEEAVKTVHAQLFRIKLVMRSMGVSNLVGQKTEEKSADTGSAAHGILTASNPGTMPSMSTAHLRQMLQETTRTEQQQITQLYEKALAAINAHASGEEKSDASKESSLTNHQLNQQNMAKDIGVQKSEQNSWVYDTQKTYILRKKLRLNIQYAAQNTTQSQTNAAADNDKMRFALQRFDSSVLLRNMHNTTLHESMISSLHQGGENAKSSSDSFFGQMFASQKTVTQQMHSLEQSVMQQVSDKMKSAVRHGSHELRLSLKPDTLGRVKINIRVEHEVVIARMQVENQQVKQIVEQNMQLLRDSLQEHNLKPGQLTVDIEAGSSNANHGQQETFDEQSGKKSRSHDSHNEELSIDPGTLELVEGEETGRRYGTNTIEYFA